MPVWDDGHYFDGWAAIAVTMIGLPSHTSMAATRTTRPQTVSADIPAMPLTVEGYSVLHQIGLCGCGGGAGESARGYRGVGAGGVCDEGRGGLQEAMRHDLFSRCGPPALVRPQESIDEGSLYD